MKVPLNVSEMFTLSHRQIVHITFIVRCHRNLKPCKSKAECSLPLPHLPVEGSDLLSPLLSHSSLKLVYLFQSPSFVLLLFSNKNIQLYKFFLLMYL